MPVTVGRAIIVAGCTYEIVAIAGGRVPTITAIVQNVSQWRGGRLALWLWLGFVVDHFIARPMP